MLKFLKKIINEIKWIFSGEWMDYNSEWAEYLSEEEREVARTGWCSKRAHNEEDD